MSIHLLERAALLSLPPSTKLVLMSFCDSADKDTGVALPGFDQVMQWAGVGRSRAHEIITELVADGYLERVAAGHKGRRAQYVVFAKVACCDLHQPFIGSATPDPIEGSGPPDPERQDSGPPDPMEVIGSGKGSGKGSTPDRTPSQLRSYEEPLSADRGDQPPVADDAGGAGKRRRKTPETPLDPAWDPMADVSLIEWAKDAGAPGRQWLQGENDEFLLWARSVDRRYSDWRAAWQKWIRKSINNGPRLTYGGSRQTARRSPVQEMFG